MGSRRVPSRLTLAGVALLVGCSTGTSTTSSPTSEPTPFGTVSSDAPSPSAIVATPTQAPSPSISPAGTTYQVRAGDTLSSIARHFGTSVAQLQSWNADRYPGLAVNPNVVQPGWVLLVSAESGATPQPAATVRPTAVETGCRAGNRVAAGSQQMFRVVPTDSRAMALTFDMGGRLDPAVEIMEFLVANRVCATIFPTGAMSQTPVGRQVLAIIGDHPELFEVGNHTMHHCDLARGGLGSPTTAPCAGGPPSADFIRRQMTDAAAILEAGTGQEPVPYWRPPYGSYNQAVLDAVASVGYTKTFMWDIDTIDWKPTSQGGPTAAQIASKVVNNAVPGSNVLMHLGGYETLDALRIMVPGLRERGFTLTSLSDLLN